MRPGTPRQKKFCPRNNAKQRERGIPSVPGPSAWRGGDQMFSLNRKVHSPNSSLKNFRTNCWSGNLVEPARGGLVFAAILAECHPSRNRLGKTRVLSSYLELVVSMKAFVLSSIFRARSKSPKSIGNIRGGDNDFGQALEIFSG